jgi:uncharacterized protein (TIGR00369 family)
MTTREVPDYAEPAIYAQLGMAVAALGDGRCTIALAARHEYTNTRGEMHGGIVSALLDTAMSRAVRTTCDKPVSIATINLNLSFIAPAHGDLRGHGHVVKSGGGVAFAHGEAKDAQGKVVATATATFRVVVKK